MDNIKSRRKKEGKGKEREGKLIVHHISINVNKKNHNNKILSQKILILNQ